MKASSRGWVLKKCQLPLPPRKGERVAAFWAASHRCCQNAVSLTSLRDVLPQTMPLGLPGAILFCSPAVTVRDRARVGQGEAILSWICGVHASCKNHDQACPDELPPSLGIPLVCSMAFPTLLSIVDSNLAPGKLSSVPQLQGFVCFLLVSCHSAPKSSSVKTTPAKHYSDGT